MICLINPPTSVNGGQIYFPMALVALGSALKEKGIPVEIIDFDLEVRQDPQLADWDKFRRHATERLAQSKATLFGISSICSNFPISILIAQEIRRYLPHSKIILGGPQPSAIPIETLQSFPWIDTIVIGEGERALVDLATCDWKSESLENIPGIAFHKGIEIKTTPRAKLMENLDTLPFPDFSLVPLKQYLTMNQGIALIEAGRGCPFLCTFCSTSLMWERQFRLKSPARILEEMCRLSSEYAINSFSLTHDNFTTSHQQLANFCHFFESHNQEHYSWVASARPDTINAERIQAMANSGCSGLFMGVDTGSQRMQKRIEKHLDISRFKENLTTAVSYGLQVTTSFIVGYTEETEEDLNQTAELALWSKLAGANEVQLYRLIPHAGTKIFEETRANLILDQQSEDASIQPIKHQEITGLIKNYPDLFSSYYSIPATCLGGLTLAFAVFYDTTINQLAPIVQRLLQATDSTPIELFQRWNNWREFHYPQRAIEGSFIFDTLPEFLQACLTEGIQPRSRGSFIGLPTRLARSSPTH